MDFCNVLNQGRPMGSGEGRSSGFTDGAAVVSIPMAAPLHWFGVVLRLKGLHKVACSCRSRGPPDVQDVEVDVPRLILIHNHGHRVGRVCMGYSRPGMRSALGPRWERPGCLIVDVYHMDGNLQV